MWVTVPGSMQLLIEHKLSPRYVYKLDQTETEVSGATESRRTRIGPGSDLVDEDTISWIPYNTELCEYDLYSMTFKHFILCPMNISVVYAIT